MFDESDPAPLTAGQLWALTAQRHASCCGACTAARRRSRGGEAAPWRFPISPSARTRSSLERKRTHAHGAALFWTLPRTTQHRSCCACSSPMSSSGTSSTT